MHNIPCGPSLSLYTAVIFTNAGLHPSIKGRSFIMPDETKLQKETNFLFCIYFRPHPVAVVVCNLHRVLPYIYMHGFMHVVPPVVMIRVATWLIIKTRLCYVLYSGVMQINVLGGIYDT